VGQRQASPWEHNGPGGLFPGDLEREELMACKLSPLRSFPATLQRAGLRDSTAQSLK